MNTERLQHLITILKDVEARELGFNLAAWIFSESAGDKEETFGKPACGTVACAAGYAGLDPGFQAQGLKLWCGDQVVETVADYNRLRHEGILSINYKFDVVPVFSGMEGLEALESFFDLPSYCTSYLFDPAKYPGLPDTENKDGDPLRPVSPAMVVERIEQLLAQGPGL